MKKSTWILSLTLIGQLTWAATMNPVDSEVAETTESQQMTPLTWLLNKDNWYRLRSGVQLQVMENLGGEANFNAPNQLNLAVDSELNILDVSPDGRYVQIGLDEDLSDLNPGIDGNEPVIAWVDISQLMNGQLEEITGEELFGAGLEYMTTDVAAKKGKAKRKRRGGGGMTYCLKDVRLAARRFTSRIPTGIAYASQAYPRYRAMGWKPIAYSKSVPVGTACFFGGGRKCGKTRCGHAAIKIGANAWKGAGVKPTPFIPGRHLQGCLTPP